MRIAYLLHGSGWGGAGGSILLLLKSLKDYFFEIYLYTIENKENKAKKEYLKYSSKFIEYKLPRIDNHQAGGKTSLKTFHKIINQNYDDFIQMLIDDEIDILHLNSTVFAYLLKPIKEKTNVKTVMHVREMLPKYDNGEVQKYLISNIYQYSDKILCISSNEASQFPNAKKIEVLPNPFDFSILEQQKDGSSQINFEFRQDTTYVAMSGTFSRMKGHKEFLKVINYLNKNYDVSNMHFLVFGVNSINPFLKVMIKKLCGKSDYGYEFYKFLEKNKLEDKVSVFPMLHTVDFYYFLRNIDIYVRPSLSGDPWGRDIIEAMAFSKPIIATGRSDFFVKNGINGYLVPPGDYKELGNKIFNLIYEEKQRKIMGNKSYNIVKDKCDLEVYSKKINAIYQELAKPLS